MKKSMVYLRINQWQDLIDEWNIMIQESEGEDNVVVNTISNEMKPMNITEGATQA